MAKKIKDIKTILENFDFYESFVTKIKWSKDLFDLIITVNYFWDSPSGCKDKDINIILKDCDFAKFDVTKSVIKQKTAENRMAISYCAYCIESFEITGEQSNLEVNVYTTTENHTWLTAKCKNVLVEY